MFSDPKINKKYNAMKQGGAILHHVIYAAKELCLPGTSAFDVDHFCFQEIKKNKCTPAFLAYQGFPASLVLCLNEEVVHGIPVKDKIIENGDLVTLDLGLIYQGFIVDMAISFVAGSLSNPATQKLIKTTEQALYAVIDQIKPGLHIGDIGHTVENIAIKNSCHVIYDCAGHGVGNHVHEAPTIANYGQIGQGPTLHVGQTIAVEPIMSIGTNHTYTLSDGWTMVTEDGSLSAQSEHTLIVTEKGCEILTAA
jgi:methionyl aminopeptidase